MARTDLAGARAYWEAIYGHWPLTADEVANELHDYWIALTEVPQVYAHITGGRFTKLNTDAQAVIDAAEDEAYLIAKSGT